METDGSVHVPFSVSRARARASFEMCEGASASAGASTWQNDAVPMDGGCLRQPIGDVDAEAVAFDR